MRTGIRILTCLGFWLLCSLASAQTLPPCSSAGVVPPCQLLSGATTSTNSPTIELNGYTRVSIQVWCSSAPCTGTAQLYQQNTPDAPLAPLQNVVWTNVGSAPTGFIGPGIGYVQLQLSWLGGGWTATIRGNK